jgi:hypothetical protein
LGTTIGNEQLKSQGRILRYDIMSNVADHRLESLIHGRRFVLAKKTLLPPPPNDKIIDSKPKERVMKQSIILLLLAGSVIALTTMEASAVVCARGVHHAGCVGRAVVVVPPRGVAVRRRVY